MHSGKRLLKKKVDATVSKHTPKQSLPASQ